MAFICNHSNSVIKMWLFYSIYEIIKRIAKALNAQADPSFRHPQMSLVQLFVDIVL